MRTSPRAVCSPPTKSSHAYNASSQRSEDHLTEGAACDLEEIADYIRQDKPDASLRVTQAIYDTILRLEAFPYRGRIRQEDSSLEYGLPGLPYIVLYEVLGGAIHIKAIRHTSRDWS